MAGKQINILDRIQDSFADTDSEKISKYLDRLYAAISDYTQKIRRDSLLVLLLVAAFELVNSSPGTPLSVASFKFHRGSVVLQFVPAVVAYLFLQINTDGIKLADMGITFRRLFRRWLGERGYPETGGFILPATPLYWNIKQSLPSKDIIQHHRYVREYRTSTWFTTILVLGILVFEGHAYFVLYSGKFPRDILWLLSLCFTLVCLVLSGRNFIDWYRTARTEKSSLA